MAWLCNSQDHRWFHLCMTCIDIHLHCCRARLRNLPCAAPWLTHWPMVEKGQGVEVHHLREKNLMEFFFVSSIVHSTPLVQDFNKLGDYFVMDVVDHTGDVHPLQRYFSTVMYLRIFILYLVWYPLLLGLARLDSIISVLVMVRFHDLISKSPVNVYQSTEHGSWKYITCQTTNEQTKGEHPSHVVLLMIFTFTATIWQFPHQISPVCLLVHLKHCLKPNNEINKQRERLQVWEAWKASLWRWVWLLVCENCLFLIPKLSISFLTTHQHSFLYTITTTL